MKPEMYQRVVTLITSHASTVDDRLNILHEVASEEPANPQQRLSLLLRFLADPVPVVREKAIWALSVPVSPEICNLLRDLTNDSDEGVQLQVLKILAEVKDSAVYPVAARLVCHGTERQRMTGLIALSLLGDAQAEGLLAILWESSDLSFEKRFIIAQALARLGNPVGEVFLEDYLPQCQNLWRRARVAAALARLGNRHGLLDLLRIVEQSSAQDQHMLRFLFAQDLNIPEDLSDQDWTEAVVAWVRQHDQRATDSWPMG
jgi:HEAT repeat protein